LSIQEPIIMDKVARLEQVRSRAVNVFEKTPCLKPEIKGTLILAISILPFFKGTEFQARYILINQRLQNLEDLI
jgi:hypothetical protein